MAPKSTTTNKIIPPRADFWTSPEFSNPRKLEFTTNPEVMRPAEPPRRRN